MKMNKTDASIIKGLRVRIKIARDRIEACKTEMVEREQEIRECHEHIAYTQSKYKK